MEAEFGCGNSGHGRSVRARRTLESMSASVDDGSSARRCGQPLRRGSGRLLRQTAERLVISNMTGRMGCLVRGVGVRPSTGVRIDRLCGSLRSWEQISSESWRLRCCTPWRCGVDGPYVDSPGQIRLFGPSQEGEGRWLRPSDWSVTRPGHRQTARTLLGCEGVGLRTSRGRGSCSGMVSAPAGVCGRPSLVTRVTVRPSGRTQELRCSVGLA